MENFIKENPTIIMAFITLLTSYFLWSSNQTLLRINKTLDLHAKLIQELSEEFFVLKGEHNAEMRDKK
jgi:hypothetical protein